MKFWSILFVVNSIFFNNSLADKFFDLEDYFSGAISLEKYPLSEGNSVAYYSSIDKPIFNVFLQRSVLEEPEKVIANVSKFLSKWNVANWTYVLPSELDTLLLRDALNRYGFEFQESSTAMVCDVEDFVLEQVAAEQNPGTLTISPVEHHQRDWLEVMRLAFEDSEEAVDQYAQALQRAKDKGTCMQHFLGHINGKAVSTITLTFLNDSMRIDNVGTHPDFQRLGYGSQLIQFAKKLAQQNGTKYCFLDAAATALGLYKRHGFSELFTYNIYECK